MAETFRFDIETRESVFDREENQDRKQKKTERGRQNRTNSTRQGQTEGRRQQRYFINDLFGAMGNVRLGFRINDMIDVFTRIFGRFSGVFGGDTDDGGGRRRRGGGGGRIAKNIIAQNVISQVTYTKAIYAGAIITARAGAQAAGRAGGFIEGAVNQRRYIGHQQPRIGGPTAGGGRGNRFVGIGPHFAGRFSPAFGAAAGTAGTLALGGLMLAAVGAAAAITTMVAATKKFSSALDRVAQFDAGLSGAKAFETIANIEAQIRRAQTLSGVGAQFIGARSDLNVLWTDINTEILRNIGPGVISGVETLEEILRALRPFIVALSSAPVAGMAAGLEALNAFLQTGSLQAAIAAYAGNIAAQQAALNNIAANTKSPLQSPTITQQIDALLGIQAPQNVRFPNQNPQVQQPQQVPPKAGAGPRGGLQGLPNILGLPGPLI
jgi:hypothetical protein